MRQRLWQIWLGTGLLTWLLGGLPTANADMFYVNNVIGDDAFDGRSESGNGILSGPVRSLRRAMHLARIGDTISLAKTDVPYYESISLVGARLGGLSNELGVIPLTLLGNGATLSGLRQFPPEAWKTTASPGVFRTALTRKGHALIVRGQTALPRWQPAEASSAVDLEDLPVGSWTGHRGVIYYRPEEKVNPNDEPLGYAAEDVGITICHAKQVRIVNLTVEHFRIDGVSAQHLCQSETLEKFSVVKHGVEIDEYRRVRRPGAYLEDVTCRENGRAGVHVGGTAYIQLSHCSLGANQEAQLLITGKGGVDVEESDLGGEPTIVSTPTR